MSKMKTFFSYKEICIIKHALKLRIEEDNKTLDGMQLSLDMAENIKKDRADHEKLLGKITFLQEEYKRKTGCEDENN